MNPKFPWGPPIENPCPEFTEGQLRDLKHKELGKVTASLKLTNWWLESRPDNKMLLRDQERLIGEMDNLLEETQPINFINDDGLNYFEKDNLTARYKALCPEVLDKAVDRWVDGLLWL